MKMKNFATTGMIALLMWIATPISTHAQAGEAAVSYNKTNANGYVVNVEGDKEVLNASLDDYFKKAFNSKFSTSKGFKTFKGVSWPEVAADKLDVYYKVDGRKGKNTVTVLVSKGYDNFINGASDANIADGVKNFMNTIQAKTVSASIANAIAAAQKVVDEAQKDYDKVVKKEGELRKSKEKMEKDLLDQQKDLADKEKTLNQAKANLQAAGRS
ncbi:MAG: hypothetical protein EOP54_02375 [Sphingobacteriales bacterium]|nr:MAG: hypothetical protein EOP54_02375 [Sphingobacteriales bacterium]